MSRGRAPGAGEGVPVAADPARVAAGWVFRFVADRARAEEAVRLYQELGFEVAADPVAPGNLAQDCEGCPVVDALGFRMIYTRRPERP